MKQHLRSNRRAAGPPASRADSTAHVIPILALMGQLVLAFSAHAVDGVLEINQTCAVNTGCFSGDTAGFPVTIDGSAGRSYRLTGDLVLPNGNTHGVRITTQDVGIDLNAFAIIGTACVGATNSSCPARLGNWKRCQRGQFEHALRDLGSERQHRGRRLSRRLSRASCKGDGPTPALER